MKIPNWLTPYIKRSEILQTLVKWLQDGLSDADIASRWGTRTSAIYSLRCRWRLFRDDECPDCGSQDYKAGVCLERRCFNNWSKEVLQSSLRTR